ncbi:transposase [Caballeronia catudaia]|uniref:Transposase n=1 Tax=Caballeronia catudaia TaxID=1777136 RepID=A0A158DKR7_9BURK|nr:transposase [Caballeronia catudaia]
MITRGAYPTDVSDEEWSFVVPYLTLMDSKAPQRKYELREMFNALRWLARAGAAWRMLPTNFPPWELVYQQTQRWLQAGCFEAMVSDLRSIVRVAQGRQEEPSAVILDGRTLQSTCETAHARAMTAINVSAAARCTWLLIPSASCLRCT